MKPWTRPNVSRAVARSEIASLLGSILTGAPSAINRYRRKIAGCTRSFADRHARDAGRCITSSQPSGIHMDLYSKRMSGLTRARQRLPGVSKNVRLGSMNFVKTPSLRRMRGAPESQRSAQCVFGYQRRLIGELSSFGRLSELDERPAKLQDTERRFACLARLSSATRPVRVDPGITISTGRLCRIARREFRIQCGQLSFLTGNGVADPFWAERNIFHEDARHVSLSLSHETAIR